jgi:hypothetical protein
VISVTVLARIEIGRSADGPTIVAARIPVGGSDAH